MHDHYNLETSPPTTDISELENQPPSVSPSLSPSLSTSLSPSLPSLHNGICQQIHRNSQLPMKIKQEVSDESSKYQSHDRCDTNNNSNINIIINNKTKVAKQILTVIRNDDYEEFLNILRSKPDLNVFIDGQTALHYCLLFGRDVSWCRQLVLNGARLLSNHDGWHPLHLAASYGHNEILSYLINCNTSKGVNCEVL